MNQTPFSIASHKVFRATRTLTFRPIQSGDEEILLQIFASTREEERLQLGWPHEEWEAFIRQQFSFQHAQYMMTYANPSFDLVLLDGEVTGRLYVDRTTEEIRVVDVALLPKHRHQGLGRLMLQALIDESDACGTPLGLHVEKDNPILNYYQRLGFVPVADRGVYLYMQRPCAARSEAA